MSILNIPDKIIVGFNERKDTFTGKLGFVVYKDEKGNLKKEKSFNNWIDKKIEVLEFDNTPQDGYILNKDISRGTYLSYSGRTFFRVYDPRGFEFEISPENLMNILANTDCSRNEIKDKCVFSWNGTSLVLLTENSIDYQESIKSKKDKILYQDDKNSGPKNFSLRNLEKGKVYCSKSYSKNCLYVGYMPFQKNIQNDDYLFLSFDKSIKKHHVFYNFKNKKFVALAARDISHVVEGDKVAGLSEQYFDKLSYIEKSIFSSPCLNSKFEPLNFDIISEVMKEINDIQISVIYDKKDFNIKSLINLNNKEESKYDFISKIKKELFVLHQYIFSPQQHEHFFSEQEKLIEEMFQTFGFPILNYNPVAEKAKKEEEKEIREKFSINPLDKKIILNLKDKIDFLNEVNCKIEVFKISSNEYKIII